MAPSKQQVCAGLEKQGLRLLDDGLAGRALTVDALREGAASVSQEDFRFDPVIPNVVVCHPEQRDDLAQAAIVRKCYLVLQAGGCAAIRLPGWGANSLRWRKVQQCPRRQGHWSTTYSAQSEPPPLLVPPGPRFLLRPGHGG